jgi:hypothetical protein
MWVQVESKLKGTGTVALVTQMANCIGITGLVLSLSLSLPLCLSLSLFLIQEIDNAINVIPNSVKGSSLLHEALQIRAM